MEQTAQERQRQMMKIVQEREQAKVKLFSEKMNSEPFPADKLSQNWRNAAHTAILNTQPLSQRISLGEFAKVMDCDILGRGSEDSTITLFQFGVLSNSLEAVSPTQLGLNQKQYVELVEEAVGHIKYYAERLAKIKKEAEDTVELEQAGKNGKPFSTIKGEA